MRTVFTQPNRKYLSRWQFYKSKATPPPMLPIVTINEVNPTNTFAEAKSLTSRASIGELTPASRLSGVGVKHSQRFDTTGAV